MGNCKPASTWWVKYDNRAQECILLKKIINVMIQDGKSKQMEEILQQCGEKLFVPLQIFVKMKTIYGILADVKYQKL